MPQTAIFSPFFATIALTFLVWTFMYVGRIRFIDGNQLTPGELAIPGRLAELSPPSVSNPADASGSTRSRRSRCGSSRGVRRSRTSPRSR